MWKEILFVGIGGAFGSIIRFVLSRLVIRYVAIEWTFAGTLAVNITGCFLIGLLTGWMLAYQPENQLFRLLLIVGFCGGYTTFSTFAFENLRLIQTNQWSLFAFYTLTSIILGLVAIWGGMKLVRVLN